MAQRYFRADFARIYGAPIFVHWSVLLVACLLAVVSWRTPLHAVIVIASYLAIIVVHEIGHAFVANKLCCKVHSVKVGFLHGLCEFEMPHSEWEHVLITWGGVLAQLVLATPVLVLAWLFDGFNQGVFAPIVAFLGYINLLIALVNLAPGAGLDGQKAWRVVPLLLERRKARAATLRVITGAKRKK